MRNVLIKSRWAVPALFLCIVALGLRVCPDYGVSWDEKIERRSGLFSLFAAADRLCPGALPAPVEAWGADRYYGMGLQHVFLAAELAKGCDLGPPGGTRDGWLLRHAITWGWVCLGLWAIYRTGRILWRDRWRALTPVALFFMMPRWVAESFYNAKDMGTFAAVAFGGWLLIRFLKKPSVGNAALLGAAVAFACSIRLAALELLLAALAGWGWITYRRREFHPAAPLTLLLVFAPLLVLFYPAAWGENPFGFFADAIRFMGNHPWRGSVRFMGTDYASGTTPFYYLPVWLAVTTPIPLLALVILGTINSVKRLRRNGIGRFFGMVRLLWLGAFWGALAVLACGVGAMYNGWRQFYFLGWPMLMLGATGVFVLVGWAAVTRRRRWILTTAAAVWLALHIGWMGYAHPYEYLYFNVLAFDPANRFEQDYWQLSFADALRKIAADAAETGRERVGVGFNYAAEQAWAMLEKPAAARIAFVSRRGHFDWYVVFNSYDWRPEQSAAALLPTRPPREPGREITQWVPNSLFFRWIPAYRAIAYRRVPGGPPMLQPKF